MEGSSARYGACSQCSVKLSPPCTAGLAASSWPGVTPNLDDPQGYQDYQGKDTSSEVPPSLTLNPTREGYEGH